MNFLLTLLTYFVFMFMHQRVRAEDSVEELAPIQVRESPSVDAVGFVVGLKNYSIRVFV